MHKFAHDEGVGSWGWDAMEEEEEEEKKTCVAGISGRDFGKLCTMPFLTDRPSPVRNPPKSQISSSGSRSTHLLFSRPSFALHVLTAGAGGDEVVGEWGKSGEKTPRHDGGLHIRTAGPK